MDSTPTVSIVLPTFNRGHLLPRSIKCALEQTLSNFELIIVNDGSTDDTVNIVKQISDQRITLINLDRNQGATYARNVGIAAARAELIAFLDSDDEWLPTKLELQVDRLNSCPDPLAAVVYCLEGKSYQSFREDQESQTVSTRKCHEGDVFLHLCTRELCPTTSMVLIRRSALIHVGGFDITLPSHQDCDLFLKLAQTSHHFIAVNKVMIFKHNSEVRISKDLDAKIRGIEIMRCKWGRTIKLRCGQEVYDRWTIWFFDLVDRVKMEKAVSDGNMILAYTVFLKSLIYMNRRNFWGRVYALFIILFQQDQTVYNNIQEFYRSKLKMRLSNLKKGQFGAHPNS
jgi:glycosyltransferase involved in cell wall biosynthesis